MFYITFCIYLLYSSEITFHCNIDISTVKICSSGPLSLLSNYSFPFSILFMSPSSLFHLKQFSLFSLFLIWQCIRSISGVTSFYGRRLPLSIQSSACLPYVCNKRKKERYNKLFIQSNSDICYMVLK